MNRLLTDVIKDIPEAKCKGIILKASSNSFVTDKYIAFNTKLTVAKRKSCSGCEKCDWVLTDFAEHMSCCDGQSIINMEIIQEGKFYMLDICNVSRDWETGFVDAYDFKLTEIENENIN